MAVGGVRRWDDAGRDPDADTAMTAMSVQQNWRPTYRAYVPKPIMSDLMKAADFNLALDSEIVAVLSQNGVHAEHEQTDIAGRITCMCGISVLWPHEYRGGRRES